jgi:hypothetical protein
MAQFCQQAGFCLKLSRAEPGSVEVSLDCYKLVEGSIFRLIDSAHASLAELFFNYISFFENCSWF